MNPMVSARPSIEAENALVMALPEPYRSACENDLAAMRGRLSVPRGEAGELRIDAVGDFTRSCGETLVGLSEILAEDRKSVVSGKSVSVRVDLGGRRIINKKKYKRTNKHITKN